MQWHWKYTKCWWPGNNKITLARVFHFRHANTKSSRPEVFWKYKANLQERLYWNRSSRWVFTCRFVVYFQNTFPKEHLRRAASEILIFEQQAHLFLITYVFLHTSSTMTSCCFIIHCVTFFFFFTFSSESRWRIGFLYILNNNLMYECC